MYHSYNIHLQNDNATLPSTKLGDGSDHINLIVEFEFSSLPTFTDFSNDHRPWATLKKVNDSSFELDQDLDLLMLLSPSSPIICSFFLQFWLEIYTQFLGPNYETKRK